MRNLLNDIEKRMPTFSKGQKLISKYILENYDKAAYMTASKLGKIVNVSESTVVRFAIELGFSGYPEFQHVLQEIVRTRLTAFQRMEVTNSLIGDGDILSAVLLGDVDKIKDTLDTVDKAAFEEAVEKISEAKNIYILGVRASSSLAGFLSHGLCMMFDNVKFIQTTSGSEMFEQIMSIGGEDVMIAISFPRYSKRIIHAVNYAKSKGTDVVAITDSEASPIAAGANQILAAKSDMASIVDSLVAPMSIINAIIVALSRKKQEDLRIRLRRLEEIWDEYDVYDKNQ
ncbi:MAG: MurR/RpiR family transcriptional regulator [Ruminococcaceae bacterium]|nr:MurR/RpiR family transcriptional regulator [Oscillospiraceae bacterium]